MKLQDLHPFDETILGLNGIYHTIGDSSYFINSPCILAANKIITKGKTYILVDNPKGTGIKMSDVKLLDAYYKDGLVYLLSIPFLHYLIQLKIVWRAIKTYLGGLSLNSLCQHQPQVFET
jgi:hypothetical protein